MANQAAVNGLQHAFEFLRAAAGKVRALGAAGVLRWLRRRLWPPRAELRVYSISVERIAPAPPSAPVMRRNEWSDLLKFVPVESWQHKQLFLTEARLRLKRGEQAFTHASPDRLLHYGWLIKEQRESLFSEVNQRFEYPLGSAVLYDFYTDPSARGQGLYQTNMRQMLAAAAALPEVKQVFISVLADNTASRHAIEKLGFQYQRSLFTAPRQALPAS